MVMTADGDSNQLEAQLAVVVAMVQVGYPLAREPGPLGRMCLLNVLKHSLVPFGWWLD